MCTCNELTSSDLYYPIEISKLQLFSDSMDSLNWMNNYTQKFDKSQNKLNATVRNKLNDLVNLCNKHPIKFKFVSEAENPADKTTRVVSFKTLGKSNFYCSPIALVNGDNDFVIEVPCPKLQVENILKTTIEPTVNQDLICLEVTELKRFSSIDRAINVFVKVLKFVNILKKKVKSNEKSVHEDLRLVAQNKLIKYDQYVCFPECVKYFASDNKQNCVMPNLVKQLNLFRGPDGLIRVPRKMKDRRFKGKIIEPILMSPKSQLSELWVRDLHVKMNHSGKYVVLALLRKEFYIRKIYFFFCEESN